MAQVIWNKAKSGSFYTRIDDVVYIHKGEKPSIKDSFVETTNADGELLMIHDPSAIIEDVKEEVLEVKVSKSTLKLKLTGS
jgi:hypothetical protein